MFLHETLYFIGTSGTIGAKGTNNFEIKFEFQPKVLLEVFY
jgi:hypothetical protein